MSALDDAVLEFIGSVATVRRAFRRAQGEMEKRDCFASVTSAVEPGKGNDDDPDFAQRGVTLLVYLSAELKASIDRNKHWFGVQIQVRKAGAQWLADGQIDWSGSDFGGDAIEESALQVSTLDELTRQLPAFAARLLEQYRAHVDADVAHGRAPLVPGRAP